MISALTARQRRKSPSSPPQLRRGGCAIKKDFAKPLLKAQTRWCWSIQSKRSPEPTTPSAPSNDASRHLLDRRGHPSLSKEGSFAHLAISTVLHRVAIYSHSDATLHFAALVYALLLCLILPCFAHAQ